MNNKNSFSLKVSDAAKILHVSTQTVRDWTDAGKLTAETTNGGHRLYNEQEVRLLSYAEKGITTYWSTGVTFQLVSANKLEFLDENWEPHSSPKFSEPVEQKLTAYMNYSNGLQYLPKKLIANGDYAFLSPLPTDTQELLSSPIETFSGPEGSRLQTFVEVAAFSKETAAQKVKELLLPAVQWVKANSVPTVGITSWRNLNGDIYPAY